MLCRHCQKKKANRPRRLCWRCYYAPGVREQYRAAYGYDPAEYRDGPRAPRRPEEPPCRCLWCQRYRCGRPLALCAECQAEYERMAVRIEGEVA